ncbi:MAG: DUF6452 family protein [Bacteroidales bacterium]|nr:DUF6452 family protein [Bacteroidales bacterium]
MNLRILLLSISILMSGCITVELCDESYDSELVARFKTEKEGVISDSTVSSLTLYGIREGLPDSLLYNSISASGFEVPLDPGHNYSRFAIQVDTLYDTLTIFHRHEIYLISYSCGFGSLFTLEKPAVSGSGIIKKDSILEETIDAVYESNEEHIWLFL